MTYPPGSPGYPSARSRERSTRAHPAVRQSARNRCPRRAEQAAGVSEHRRRRVRPRHLPDELRPAVPSEHGPRAAAPTLLLVHRRVLLAGLLAGVEPAAEAERPVGHRRGRWPCSASCWCIAGRASSADGVVIGWAFYLFVVFTVLQAIAAVAELLLDAGVITAPAPKPKYEQQPYGQYGRPPPYYGQPTQPAPAVSRGQQHAAAARGYPPRSSGGYSRRPSTAGWLRRPRPASRAARRPRRPDFPAFGQPPGRRRRRPTAGPDERQQPQQPAAQQSAPPPS